MAAFRAVAHTSWRICPPLDVGLVVLVQPDPGPFVSGFAAWLDKGHGVTSSRGRHVGHVKEFLAWYDVNPHDDVVSAAREYAQYGTHQQATSMRLLLEWLSDR